jgi:hypothetical protein
MTGRAALRRARIARPATAGTLGGLLLALVIAAVPLSRLAHQSLSSSGGSIPVWISAAYGAVGVIVAWRKPGNPLGWVFLLAGLFTALSEDASYYMVADYRLHHGGLPLGWAAVLTQPGWAHSTTLLGVAILLFPDGRPRRGAPRWPPPPCSPRSAAASSTSSTAASTAPATTPTGRWRRRRAAPGCRQSRHGAQRPGRHGAHRTGTSARVGLGPRHPPGLARGGLASPGDGPRTPRWPKAPFLRHWALALRAR